MTPLYGVRMAGMDRLVQDCHAELRLHNQHSVHIVGLWPGPVNSEKFEGTDHASNAKQEVLFDEKTRETVEFPGRLEHSRSEMRPETGTERIYYGWDRYIADASAYNRSFPCMEATLNAPRALGV